MDSTSSRLATRSCSSALRSGVLQSPAMKLSAKPMSPDLSAAPKTFQLERRIAARGSPSARLPKRTVEPSGRRSSSDPWRIRSRRRITARAAAGAPRASAGVETVVLLERFMRVAPSGSAGHETARRGRLAKERHALAPELQGLPVDARDDAERHPRRAEEGRALRRPRQRLEHAGNAGSDQQAVVVQV